MTRHLFFAIALIGTGVLLNTPSEASIGDVKTEPLIAWAGVPTGRQG